MKGWKTWAAALALILPGAGMILGGLANDFDLAAIKEGAILIGGGLGMIGIGHKIEKASS